MPKKILVVDDDNEMREEISGILREENFDVDTAGDGLEAEKKIEKSNFDAVVLDLKLPGVNGVDVLKFIRENSIKTRVIIITGSLLDSNWVDEKLGDMKSNKKLLQKADMVLGKPFDIKTLLFGIKKVTAEKYGK